MEQTPRLISLRWGWDTTSKMKIFLIFLLSCSAFAKNQTYIEVVKEQHLEQCELVKENIYLSKEQRSEIEKRSKTKLYGGLALRYISKCKDGKQVFHYVDSHIVRTLNETVVITIEDDQIKNYKVASFNEPPEYRAPDKWLAQFQGKGAKTLKVREDIDALSGATLTVGSSIKAANRIMALHSIYKN